MLQEIESLKLSCKKDEQKKAQQKKFFLYFLKLYSYNKTSYRIKWRKMFSIHNFFFNFIVKINCWGWKIMKIVNLISSRENLTV